MDERLHGAFGSVRADEALKDRTKAFLAREIARRERRSALPVRRLAPVLACLLLLLVGFGGYQFYFTPVAAIRLEINPALELGVNRLGRVVSSQGLNEDGEALAQEVDVRFLPYEEALERLMADSRVEEPLEAGALLSIEVIGDDETGTGEILAAVETCTAGSGNVSCCAGSAGEAAEAAEHGLTLSRYRLYTAIRALDPSFTAEEAAALTMRELRGRLAALEGGASSENGGSAGAGQGNGPGDGTGAGTGQGSGPGDGAGQGYGPGDGTGMGTGAGHGGHGHGHSWGGSGNRRRVISCLRR